MKAEDYKTEITLEELKGHYKTHFLTAGQFMDLVKKWHKNLLIQENLDLKKQNTELAELLKKAVRIVKQMAKDKISEYYPKERVIECSCKGGSDHAVNRICQKCKGVVSIKAYK